MILAGGLTSTSSCFIHKKDACDIQNLNRDFCLISSNILLVHLPLGLAVAAGSSVYLSSLDRLSVVHQEDPSVWYLRCDVYRHLQHLPVLLSRLLSLHRCLRVGVLFTSAEPGKMLFHVLKLFKVKYIYTNI